MSLRGTSETTTGAGAATGRQDVRFNLETVTRERLLAQSCDAALRRLVDATGSDCSTDDLNAWAAQCLLEGTGFARAGVAWFSEDRTTATIAAQCSDRMLQECAVFDIAEVAMMRPLLAGAGVNITECAAEHCAHDALLRELSMSCFFAEPIVGEGGEIAGFLFVADGNPLTGGGMTLRTFLSNVATRLGRGNFLAPPQPARGRRAEDRTDLVIDTLQNMGIGIIVFDADLEILAVNQQAYELLDVKEDVLHAGASLLDLINHFGRRGDYGPEGAQEQIDRMQQMVASREPRSFERRLPDGRIIACKAQPRKDGYVVTYTDVTEYYARERIRLENEILLSETLNHMEQGLIVFDASMRILAVNEQTHCILDVPHSIVSVGGSMETFVHHCAQRGDYGPGDAVEKAAKMLAMLKQGEGYTVERLLDDDRTVVCVGRPRSDGGYIVTYTDVTRWRRSEEELGSKTELLSVALEYMDQGLIVYDRNMMIEAFNGQAKLLLNAPDHVLQAGASMITLIEFWIRQTVGGTAGVAEDVQTIQGLVSGQELFTFERELRNGRIVLCSGRPREHRGYVMTLTDVTETKRQKRELAEKTSMMEDIIQHMDQGLLAFDGDGKLLFSNERAKMMLGVSRDLFEPGRSFEAIVHHGANGKNDPDTDNGPSADQLLALVGGTDPFSFERKCTGNTTALVRFHPRPAGGYIVTYTDITPTRRQQDELADLAEALRQKSLQLDRIFNNMGSAVAMFDADCKLVICNPRYQAIFQLPSELTQPGADLADICAHNALPGTGSQAETHTAERIAVATCGERRQFNMNSKDGRIIHAVHEPLDDGGSIAVYEDVTAQEAADTKLREYAADLEHQKALLQTVLEHMEQGISLFDGDLAIQAFNSRFLELLGFPAHMFQPGDPMEKFFRYNAERGEYGPGDPEQQVRERLELTARFEPHSFVRERPDGTAIKIVGTPLPDRGGFVTTYSDITDTVRSEVEIKALAERLSESSRRLDAAFNNMNQGVAMFDENHKLLVRNKRYLEIFQFPEDIAAEGAALEDITRYSVERGFEGDADRALAKRMEVAALRERALYLRNMTDGRVVEIIHEPLDNGGSLALYLDVTEREMAARSLREHAAKLEASNRELQEFAYVAAHDLQEPLRKIEAFGDRLHKKCGDRLGENGQRYVSRMQASSRRLRALIDALLDYSRVTTKAAPLSEVDLQVLAQNVVSDLETSIERADATVELGELPKIDGDEMQLRQLFINLIGNSLKFRHESRPPRLRIDAAVERRSVPEGGNNDVCVLVFEDNGIGFDKKFADRIFTIFQRLHTRSEYEGTGIGLATCRKIVERHRGTIQSEGTPDQGAVFTITLPVRQDASSWTDAAAAGA